MRLSRSWATTFETDTEGRFFCPIEGVDRRYEAGWEVAERRLLGKVLRRRTLGAAVVRCSVCGTQFDLGVLGLPTTKTMAHTLDAVVLGSVGELLRVMAAGPELVGNAHRILADHLCGVSEVALVAEIACVRSEEVDLLAADASVFLTEAGKRTLLTTCARIARLRGDLDPAAVPVLDRIGGALGLEPSGVRGVLASVSGN